MYAGALQLIFLALSCKWVGADLFSATADIESLMETHSYIIDTIERYLESQEYRLEILRKYLNYFKKDEDKMKRDDKYVFNPINAFSLIHKLTEDLQNIEHYLQTNVGELEIPDDLRLPLEEDLHGAAVGLGRLQKTYDLNVTLLAAGQLKGTYSHGNKLYLEETSPLTVGALLQVGRQLYIEREYDASLDWLHAALLKYYNYDLEDPYGHDDSHIIDYIRNAYHGVNDFKSAIEWTERLMQLRPMQANLYDSMVFYYNQLGNTTADVTPPENPLDEITELCRGEVLMPDEKRKVLHCHYKCGPSPFLLLAPIKAELLHRDPDVYLFYDTISDAEIKHIRNATQSELERSQVHARGEWQADKSRISKTGWLYDSDSPVVERVSMRVADFTGLSMDTAEALQIANYGIGGHYDPHYDFLEEDAEDDGDRIATVMFYMSDVEQGGATVFIKLNLTVFPVKHAAIFWQNLLPSGQPDYRSYHAACPVLRGSKWASNKWIHEVGQEFIRPCGLEYQENK